ncbi:MAG: phosphonate ABC transporter ATP-binding protein [Bacteroidetes bacterium]|nr:MAG: phosphonate ABC transporter ATP-binding protein [Bacteroidota bacterium]
MIKLHNLTKIYQAQGVETRALSEVDLTVKKGEFVSIMGPSGCGKTTLLNIIGLLDSYNEGLFVFNDANVSDLNERQKLKLRKEKIGFVFQNFNLIDDLTVIENIELPLHYLGYSAQDRRQRVLEVLEMVGMGHRRDFFPYQLSGGQQQKVAVGRAIIAKPSLILADEPTGNLDSTQGNEIMEMLSRLNDQGTTLIMVTHSSHDASYSQRIVRIMDGQVVSEKKVLHAQF